MNSNLDAFSSVRILCMCYYAVPGAALPWTNTSLSDVTDCCVTFLIETSVAFILSISFPPSLSNTMKEQKLCSKQKM